MIVQSTFIWANHIYLQILRTVCYISGERLKENIEVDLSYEWKG